LIALRLSLLVPGSRWLASMIARSGDGPMTTRRRSRGVLGSWVVGAVFNFEDDSYPMEPTVIRKRCVRTIELHAKAIGITTDGLRDSFEIMNMNINARSAGPPSCFLLASRSPVSCNSEKARFSDAPHAPASRRPRCRCRSRWPRASVPQLRSSRTLWPGLSCRRAKGLERRADKSPLKTSGAWPRCSRPAVWMMRHHPQRSRAAYTQISFHSS